MKNHFNFHKTAREGYVKVKFEYILQFSLLQLYLYVVLDNASFSLSRAESLLLVFHTSIWQALFPDIHISLLVSEKLASVSTEIKKYLDSRNRSSQKTTPIQR